MKERSKEYPTQATMTGFESLKQFCGSKIELGSGFITVSMTDSVSSLFDLINLRYYPYTVDISYFEIQIFSNRPNRPFYFTHHFPDLPKKITYSEFFTISNKECPDLLEWYLWNMIWRLL